MQLNMILQCWMKITEIKKWCLYVVAHKITQMNTNLLNLVACSYTLLMRKDSDLIRICLKDLQFWNFRELPRKCQAFTVNTL